MSPPLSRHPLATLHRRSRARTSRCPPAPESAAGDPVSAAAMRWLAVGSNPSSCSAHVRLVPAHLFLYLCHTRMPPSSSTVLHPPGSISVPHCVVDLVRT
jgi:hypothetical protein